MQTDPSKIRTSPTEMYKNRVEAVKNKLPRNWRDLLLKENNIYNNNYGLQLLNNVYSLQTADVRITELMEAISKKYVDDLIKSTQAA